MTEKMPEDLKDLDNLKPIDHAVIARPHTPVYKMHRYFARRPWSVFRSLIEHYSNPGSIILDPFCGGGVTVVEGLRLGRKVIGVDINPLATFITSMEVVDVDMDELKAAFEQIETACRKKIEELYATNCSKCGSMTIPEWIEWTVQLRCPHCSHEFTVSETKKMGAGRYKCPNVSCGESVKWLDAEQLPDRIVRLKVTCSCGFSKTQPPTKHDYEQFTKAACQLEKLKNLIPHERTEELLRNWKPEKLRLTRRGVTNFSQLFTSRNAVALAMLIDTVQTITQRNIQPLLVLSFSNALAWATKLCYVKRQINSWAKHAYNLRDRPLEMNVWNAFAQRFDWTMRGKKYSEREIGKEKCKLGSTDDLISGGATCALLTQSSHDLPLPDESIDAIITDPPYGANVNYLDLSNFWLVWINRWVDKDGKYEYEAIENKHCGKGIDKYRALLYEVFRECHRVLKPHRWMVMTFHNTNFRVWNAIHLAAHDAGFRLAEHDGMIYQPPVHQYETTSHAKESRSMLGDFILSFQKVEKQPDFKQIEHAETGLQIERLSAEAVLHHQGASLSLIYMKLMPWLLNNNLLDKISEKELVPYLTNSFEEKDGKWRLKENPGGELKQALEEYSRQHYKASYEDLNFVPVEARIEYLIRRLLYSRGFATQDDILNTIYENLINSNMAEAREIQQVLNSIATLMPISQAAAGKVSKGKTGRKVWKLKEDIEREKLFAGLGVDVEYRLATSEESDHDLAIARLVEMAGLRKLKANIGKTEQVKYTDFRKLTSDLPAKVAGMPKAARDIVEQIDVLWHNGGKGIVAAFEVERTTTITSGIDRFRNLLTMAPESEIELYIVVPKSRGNEVRNKLGSPANRKDGLHKKIGYIYLEDLDIRHAVAAIDFEKIRHFINGGQ